MNWIFDLFSSNQENELKEEIVELKKAILNLTQWHKEFNKDFKEFVVAVSDDVEQICNTYNELSDKVNQLNTDFNNVYSFPSKDYLKLQPIRERLTQLNSTYLDLDKITLKNDEIDMLNSNPNLKNILNYQGYKIDNEKKMLIIQEKLNK